MQLQVDVVGLRGGGHPVGRGRWDVDIRATLQQQHRPVRPFRQRRAQIGIVLLARRFHFGESGQRLGSLQVIDDGEVLIEIRKQQHGQIEAAALHAELSFLQVTLPRGVLDF